MNSLFSRMTRFWLAAVCGLLASLSSFAMPQPMVIYYGQALDRYGQVYREGASVFLKLGNHEVARSQVVGGLAPGVNFVLTVPYDDAGIRERYDKCAVSEGDVLTVWVNDAYGERQVNECEIPPVGEEGEVTRLRLLTGEDSDGDGMTDAWERANGLNPADPSDATLDDDQDGQNNLEEYLAGTLPWLETDLLCLTSIKVVNQQYVLTFASVYGRMYHVEATSLDSLGEDGALEWSPCPFRLSAEGNEVWEVEGTEGEMTLYLDVEIAGGMWRIALD